MRIRARDDEGNLRTVSRIRMRDSTGTLRTVYSAMSVSLSTNSLSGTTSTATATTSSSVTVTVTGGVAPITYQWNGTVDNVDGVYAVTPTSATTSMRRSGCVSGSLYAGFHTCTVTDATGYSVTTGVVSTSLDRL